MIQSAEHGGLKGEPIGNEWVNETATRASAVQALLIDYFSLKPFGAPQLTGVTFMGADKNIVKTVPAQVSIEYVNGTPVCARVRYEGSPTDVYLRKNALAKLLSPEQKS